MTFDKFDRLMGQATSIKTLQVDAKSYQKATVFRSKVKQYLEKVEEFKGYKIGDDKVFANAIKVRILQIAVPNLENTMQQKVLKEMSELANTKGIKLDLVIIKQ